jgi:hypothetical protein
VTSGLDRFLEYMEQSLDGLMESVSVHLYGGDHKEIHGGGYDAQTFNTRGNTFVFTGESQIIYGFYLMSGGSCIYSKDIAEPWQALNDADVLDVRVEYRVKVSQHG